MAFFVSAVKSFIMRLFMWYVILWLVRSPPARSNLFKHFIQDYKDGLIVARHCSYSMEFLKDCRARGFTACVAEQVDQDIVRMIPRVAVHVVHISKRTVQIAAVVAREMAFNTCRMSGVDTDACKVFE